MYEAAEEYVNRVIYAFKIKITWLSDWQFHPYSHCISHSADEKHMSEKVSEWVSEWWVSAREMYEAAEEYVNRVIFAFKIKITW